MPFDIKKYLAPGICAFALAFVSTSADALSIRMADLDTLATLTVNDQDIGPVPDNDLALFELDVTCGACAGWLAATNWAAVDVVAEVTPAPGVGALGPAQLNMEIDVESVVAANLLIEVTHTGLTLGSIGSVLKGIHQATANIAGAGAAVVEAFWDAGNVAFATTDSIGGPMLFSTPGAFQQVHDLENYAGGPFSMTTVMEISHAGATASSLNTSQAGLAPIPVPAAGVLLLGGLGLMGSFAARRKKA